jgi:hypothetical protein
MPKKTLQRSQPSKKYQLFEDREWYNLRSLLGNDWAMFYFLLGGREAGKSYATTKFFVSQWRKYRRPFTWMRLTETSAKKLLNNNAEKLIDPDIRREFNLDLITSGDNVYEVLERDAKGKVLKKEKMCRVMALSTFYNDKGSGLFDKDFLNNPDMYYNICLDEMNKEKNERRTQDILYSFTNQLENLIRSTKNRVRIICIGNTLEEASDILAGINFIPEEFGRYKLHKKRTVIDYIPLNDAYKKRREGTAANILMPDASTFTNQINVDYSHLYHGKMIKPTAIIKFGKDRANWFTMWDGVVIAPYNGEKIKFEVNMLPYADGVFNVKTRDDIYLRYQVGCMMFKNLLVQKKFKKQLELLKPNGK